MKRAIYDLPLKERRKIAKALDDENKAYGDLFVDMFKAPLPGLVDRNGTPQVLIEALRNKRFLVQIYDQGNWIRLSVNRTKYNAEQNTWAEGISWQDLMEVKRAVAFGELDAIEIYPKDVDIVDVSNMRHLFLAKDGTAPDCIWRHREEELREGDG